MENVLDIRVNNEKIQEHINKLFTEILKEQKKYMGVKKPDEEKSHLTEDLLKKYESMRGKGFFYNYMSSGRGHGPFTELVDGSIKYDLIGGIGPNLLGHSHPLYIKAQLESATSDTIMCGNLQPYPEAYQLTEALIQNVSKKSRLKNFWFTGSGSFANDLALKLIWQKQNPKYRVIAFNKAFAGRSVATQDLTHNKGYKEGMPDTVQVDHVPHFDQTNPEQSLENTISEIKRVMKENPKQHCAIMMEIIQGEGGFIYGDKAYYEGVFKFAKDNGLYIWVDEVQTFGRTRELFAYQMMGLDEYVDIVSVGKALQACGVLYTDELNPKPGLIAGTFNGSLSALNTGHKIIKYLTESHFYGDKGRNAEIENAFLSRFEHLMKTSCRDKITYAGGSGTMIAYEVGDSSKETTMKFIRKLFENGILCFMCGADPTRVRMLLPLSLTDEHIDEIFKIIESTTLEFFE